MSKNPYVSKVGENRNGSDLKAEEVPISKFETEPPFKDRLREVIGDRKLVWFAKECGFSDSLLGSYLRGEKLPGFDNLVSIARVGGVTVDWLATGRSPKTRAELKAIAVAPAVPAPPRATAAWRPTASPSKPSRPGSSSTTVTSSPTSSSRPSTSWSSSPRATPTSSNPSPSAY